MGEGSNKGIYVIAALWQSIETAPKDGTSVFIWHDGECVKAAFLLMSKYGRDIKWYILTGDRILIIPRPKYWMPLPAPPQELDI